jgi:hypothetical protein
MVQQGSAWVDVDQHGAPLGPPVQPRATHRIPSHALSRRPMPNSGRSTSPPFMPLAPLAPRATRDSGCYRNLAARCSPQPANPTTEVYTARSAGGHRRTLPGSMRQHGTAWTGMDGHVPAWISGGRRGSAWVGTDQYGAPSDSLVEPGASHRIPSRELSHPSLPKCPRKHSSRPSCPSRPPRPSAPRRALLTPIGKSSDGSGTARSPGEQHRTVQGIVDGLGSALTSVDREGSAWIRADQHGFA